MKTILFAWERGGNLGHAAKLSAIARRLAGSVRVVVAGRDLPTTEAAFSGIEHVLLQAPAWPDHRHPGAEEGQANYLDTLVSLGFGDPAKLAAVVDGWSGLIDLVRPDLIVCDHSPGLMIARHRPGTPTVAIGTGYAMPPVGYDRFPPLRADRSPIVPEGRIAGIVSEVMKTRSVPGKPDLPRWFRSEARLVLTLPELDAYQAFRREPLHLPLEPLPRFAEPPAEPRLFLYLGDEIPQLAALVQTIAAMKLPVVAYLRGEVEPIPDFLALRGHEVHAKPPNLVELLPTVSHVISAGGAFLSHAALAAGRPHLVLPQHNEARLNLEMLERLGVARELAPGEPDGLRDAVESFIADHGLVRQARHWAGVIATRQQPDGMAAAVEAIQQLLV